MASVSQVCKNDVYKDVGGNHHFQFVFSSFVKVRLSCSVQSNSPLYLEELVSVSDVFTLETSVEGKINVVFAIMKTSRLVLFVELKLKDYILGIVSKSSKY